MANGTLDDERRRLGQKGRNAARRRQGGQGGARGTAGADPSGTGQGIGNRVRKIGAAALGLGAPLAALEIAQSPVIQRQTVEAARGLGEALAKPVNLIQTTETESQSASPVTRTTSPSQPASPALTTSPRQTEFGQEDLELIQAGLPQTSTPLSQRLGEIESQRSALASLREAQIAAADGPRETRPGFENLTVVGQGGPTGILDNARARGQSRRFQAELDEIDSQQRRGRITPSAAARQKQAVLGAISAADKQDTLADIAAGRQATDLEIGQSQAASDLFSAQSRAATEGAKLNIAQQNNQVDQFFKAKEQQLGKSKQDLAAKKAISDIVSNESIGLNEEQKFTLISLISGDTALAERLFPTDEE